MKYLILLILLSCRKENIKPTTQAVTFRFVKSGDTIIHWHRIEGAELEKFKSMPRYQIVSACDNRIVELIIGDDHCFKKY